MPGRYPRKTRLVNTLGAFGYLSVLFQWLWAVVVFLPTLIDSDLGNWVTPQSGGQSAPVFAIEQPPLILTIIVIAITVLMLVVAVIALIRLPAQVMKTGKKITHTPAEALVPVVTHHKKLSKDKRKRLSARIVRIIKLSLCLVPFVISCSAYFIVLDLSYEIVVILAAAMAGLSLFWFGSQYTLARAWKLPEEAVV